LNYSFKRRKKDKCNNNTRLSIISSQPTADINNNTTSVTCRETMSQQVKILVDAKLLLTAMKKERAMVEDKCLQILTRRDSLITQLKANTEPTTIFTMVQA
jgi:hypothetical protein